MVDLITKINKFFQGKKTNIVLIIAVVLGFLKFQFNFEVSEYIFGILGILGFGTAKAGSIRAEKAIKEAKESIENMKETFENISND